MQDRLKEFLRFAIVGLATAVSGWALLYVLVSVLHIHYLIAFPITFLSMNAIAYAKAGSFAFRMSSRRNASGLSRYYAISLLSLAANWALLALLVEVAGVPYLAAVVGLTALNAPLNFLAHRKYTFRVGSNGSDPTRVD